MAYDTILIKGTARTPAIKFDAANGKLEIKGRSIPENAVEFYRPIIESIDQYLTDPVSSIQVNIQLEYLNTDSSRCILNIFRHLESIHAKGSPVIITWYYEENDMDMKETGEDYKALVGLSFILEQKKLS